MSYEHWVVTNSRKGLLLPGLNIGAGLVSLEEVFMANFKPNSPKQLTHEPCSSNQFLATYLKLELELLP